MKKKENQINFNPIVIQVAQLVVCVNAPHDRFLSDL